MNVPSNFIFFTYLSIKITIFKIRLHVLFFVLIILGKFVKRNSKIAQVLTILLLLLQNQLYSQPSKNFVQAWQPFIRNFSPQEYSAGSQNWCAVQDKNGNVYFGNTKGVLQFDGINWETISVSDEKAVFSMAIDSNETIWIGSHDEVGFLKSDSLGKLSFISILHLFADSLKPFGRIRQIIPTKKGIYFRTSKYVIRKINNSIKAWASKTSFHKMHYINESIYIYEHRIALKKIINDSLIAATGGEQFNKNPPSAIIPFNSDSLLVATWKQGLFILSNGMLSKFSTMIDEKFKDNPIIDIKFLSSKKILLAGFNKGSYVIDKNGNLLQYFDKSTGLIDEFCNGSLLDASNGLWLYNSYGISRIEINSPFSIWGRNEGITTKVRFITRFNNKIFAVTTDKVYSITENSNNNSVNKIEPSFNSCWGLLPIGDALLAGTNGGVYEVKNNNIRLLSLGQKISFCLTRSIIDTNLVYVGTSEGVALLKMENNEWVYKGHVDGIEAEIRQIYEMQNGLLWLGTHNQGIIKCKINGFAAKGEYIKRFDGFKELRSYRFTSLDNQLFFHSPLSSTLLYDESKNEFIADTLLFNSNENISRIEKDKNENIWVRKITNDGAEILYGKKKNKFSYQFNSFPYNRLIGLNAQYIYPDNNAAWFGTRFGLVKYDPNINFSIPKVYPAQIRKVRLGDSTLYAGHRLGTEKINTPELQYEKNAIRFEYSLAAFEKREAIIFQYYLEGYEDQWSEWTHETQKDYTNLFEGKYVFHVRGKDIYGSLSREDVYSFIVLPPWYRSLYAYFSYLILFIIAIFAVDRVRTEQVNKKNRIELERKLKQQQAIEKAKSEERQRVRKKTAADFHDELGHLLTRITLSTEMVRKKSKENTLVQDYLANIVKSTSQLSSGMKDLIWTLDSNKDSLLDTLIRIKDFGDTLFENSQIKFIAHGFLEEYEHVIMNMDKRRHIVLIFKEVMNNCLKYSKCNITEFKAVKIKNDILISFIDDGIGFTEENQNSGNGLKNIRMRAKSIDAELIINSSANQTEVSLLIKMI